MQKAIRLTLKGFDHRLIEKACKRIVDVAHQTGSRCIGPVPIPTRIRKTTILRSPHIDKKSRDQLEMRIHKRLLQIESPTSQTSDALSSLSIPHGVDVKICLHGE